MRHIYAEFIDKVAKPTRYLGGEYLSVNKDPASIAGRILLAFPDVYEIGMSHLGTKILYSGLNKHEDLWAERCFCPWIDMEAELRTRKLPLVSLESQALFSDFDVIGFSLQFELSYSNVLTMLDLGGIPLRSKDRANDAPLILAGGPCATHGEPVAPFFDAFFVGEAEEELAGLVREFAAGRQQGRDRLELLAELAGRYPIYVPALYETEVDEDTGMEVVGAPTLASVPARVRRAVISNIDDHPFPSDSPVPYQEAVFDRAGVEIARGCTEGCRFCQAGMIYRPVRERSPESIVKSIVDGVATAGYDETSLTCLSTADFSSITPLVKKVMSEVRSKRVSLSVSSLRAYGLGDDILDEMAQMRITGLTFAPEAGTQRMRDVVNKNVTDKHIEDSARRIFGRGWNRLKLYFMIGLPTEESEDVVGIADTGKAMLGIGRQKCGKRAEVTVSVSTFVPKPHTPFQWCAQDSFEEVGSKQTLLREHFHARGLRLKSHDRGVSWLEGVMSRGDRRVADAIELAWQRGARFDSWTECFGLQRWREALEECEVKTDEYLATRPLTARLPWDHIDVGLEDGFLAKEYRRALKERLSPPCGKVIGQLVHHSNLQDAEADDGKLVCYNCGIACDMSAMRTERLVALRQLGAELPLEVKERVVRSTGNGNNRHPARQDDDRPTRRVRLRYAKLGRVAYLGHLDTMRVLARLFRRAEIELAYTKGFHPKPNMQFSPALPLGVASFGELADIVIESDAPIEQIHERLREVSPEGLEFTGLWELAAADKGLSKLIESYDLLISPAADGRQWDETRLHGIADGFLAQDSALVRRKDKEINVRKFVDGIDVLDEVATAKLCAILDWGRVPSLLRVQVSSTPTGSAKPVEVAKALEVAGKPEPLAPAARYARLGFGGAAFETSVTEINVASAMRVLSGGTL